MDSPTSPSPPPKTVPSNLYNSSLVTPSFSSTLPFPIARSTSDSIFCTKNSNSRQKRAEAALRHRRTRSAASSQSSSGSGMDDFSIDLAKLGEKPSGLTIGDGKRVVEEMGSEDDGPEDFTLNMEKWMRGKGIWRKKNGEKLDEGNGREEEDPEAGRGRSQSQDHGQDGETEEESVKRPGSLEEDELEYEGGDESEFLPLSTSTPAPSNLMGSINYQGPRREVGTPKNQPPPLSRLNTEAKHDRAAEEVFDRISALQEEVESMRIEDEHRYSASQAQEKEHKKLQDDYEELKIQLEKERETAADWQSKQAKANEEVTALMEAAQHDAKSGINFVQAKLEQERQQLETVKSEAEASKRAADDKITVLLAELQASQDESTRHRNGAENVQAATSLLIKQLRSELETSRSETLFEQKRFAATKEEHASALDRFRVESQTGVSTARADAAMLRIELEHVQEQLMETRRIVTVVEDENDRLTQENGLQAADISKLRTAAGCNYNELEKATSTIEKLNAELNNLQSEKEDKPRQSDNQESLEDLKSQHQQTLVETQRKHFKELDTLRTTLLRAAEGMRKREARFTNAHREEVDSLKEEIKTLTQHLNANSQPQTSKDDLERTEELRKAIRILSQQLVTTKADLAATQTSLTSAREDAQAFHSEIETARAKAATARREADTARADLASAIDSNAAVNHALESRFAQVVDEREKEWRRRVNVLFRELKKIGKEREMMGKALMHGWGREEVGIVEKDERQGYRYLYAKDRERR